MEFKTLKDGSEEILRISAKYQTLPDEKKKNLLELMIKWATEELDKLVK